MAIEISRKTKKSDARFLNVRMNRELFENVSEFCDQNNITKTDLISALLEKVLAEGIEIK